MQKRMADRAKDEELQREAELRHKQFEEAQRLRHLNANQDDQ
jgi:hypothetical protein